MTLKNFLNYAHYSGIWISFVINPLHWRLSIDSRKPDDMDPALYSIHVFVGPVTLKVVWDDGSW
jgi:drug/metabolite transporter superfamily protein YnfA